MLRTLGILALVLLLASVVPPGTAGGHCVNVSMWEFWNGLPGQRVYVTSDDTGFRVYQESTNFLGGDGFQRGDVSDPCSGPQPWDHLVVSGID